MRFSILSAPLIAALSLMACSAEEQAPNEVTTAEGAGGETTADSDPVVPEGNGADTAPPPAEEDDGADPDEGAANVIPAAFHGEWNSDLEACGTGASDTRLRISADQLRFYESAGDVRQVEIESERVIEVTADYSGEGQTWTNERRLSLSEDSDTLTVSGDGATLTRSRCP